MQTNVEDNVRLRSTFTDLLSNGLQEHYRYLSLT